MLHVLIKKLQIAKYIPKTMNLLFYIIYEYRTN
jgi:hypothetical protein